ncbi:MAG TPA: isoprenylcysteine carboxylmethyltransferase family protein [Burkholderiales bacterium]|nr:isoprenylcysteine carboxylmethyltransferase family protein [Burkholderiales bacterium]
MPENRDWKNFFANYLPTLIVMWAGIALSAGDFRVRTFNGYFLIHNDSGTIWFPLTADRLLTAAGIVYTVALIAYYRLFPATVSKARIALSWLMRWARRQQPRFGFAEKQAWLAIALKFFFLPLMINFVVNNLAIVAREYHALTTVAAGFHLHLYLLLLNLLFFVDVIIFTFGYMVEIPRLDNVIRSVEPTFLGWAVCIACYPPFNGMATYVFPWQSSDAPRFTDSALEIGADCLILGLMAIYAWASVALGWKASNLTNRGVIASGPYRWVRHPAYAAKNLAWWIGALPTFAAAFSGSLEKGLWSVGCMALFTVIYAARAWTEERHLSLLGDGYDRYKQQIHYRFIPGVC